jgi:hypothetical protein
MKNLYHIVTRFTRNEDGSIRWLDNCYKSIISNDINYKWYIIGIEDDVDISKYKNTIYLKFPSKPNWKNLCNYYLDVVPDEGQWFFILDDDNLLHPNFKQLDDRIYNDTKLVIMSQLYEPDKIRVACEKNITVQKIDMAQFCIKREIINDLRFWEIYRGDGYFIMELYIRCREYGIQSQIFPEVFSYYNAQHWI